VLAIRSERESLFSIGFFSNPPMAAALIVTFLLQMATLYVPALNPIFKTEPLDMNELLLCIGISGIIFFAVEMEKFFIRRGWIYRQPGS
jgi:Ca2+-transporting ATPase